MKYLQRIDKTWTGLGIIVAAVLVATALVVRAPETPLADAGVPWFVSDVVVSNPKAPSVRTYEPGTDLNFRADFIWTYCSNEGGGQIFGRVTRPVPVGQSHTGFGAWRGGNEGKTIDAGAREVIGTGKGRKRVKLERPPVHVYKPRTASYVHPMSMPTKPGRYHFQYQLQIRTPQGNIARSGRVVFEVKDPTPSCPPSQISVPNAAGGVRCVTPNLSVQCTGSATRVDVGESVTFTATTNAPATMTWYEGSNPGGTVLGTPRTGTESTLTRSFSRPGQYQVTMLARNAQGQYGVCTRGVRVGDVLDDEEEASATDAFGNILNGDGTIMTPDGQLLAIDPTAGPATIEFALDRPVTNTTCGATWTATNVLRCYMVRGTERATAPVIEATGSAEVVPATYRVECLAKRDGAVVSSDPRVCSRNPDVREQ